MTNRPHYQEHIEILKSVPEIKKDLENIKMWTKIILNDYLWEQTVYWSVWPFMYRVLGIDKDFWLKDIERVVWNPPQERHLKMFFVKIWPLCNLDFVKISSTINWSVDYKDLREDFFKELNEKLKPFIT